MSTSPVDMVVQMEPPEQVDVPPLGQLRTRVNIFDRESRQLIDPDGGVNLISHPENTSPTSYTYPANPIIVKNQTGVYEAVLPYPTAGKWVLTWQALSSPGSVVVGNAFSLLNVVDVAP